MVAVALKVRRALLPLQEQTGQASLSKPALAFTGEILVINTGAELSKIGAATDEVLRWGTGLR
jgi:hypothetical protein